MALATRAPSGNRASPTTAPPARCAKYVTTELAAEIAKNGAFSRNNLPHLSRLSSGQKSSSNSTQGSVTIIGLDRIPRTNAPIAAAYQRLDLVHTYVPYAPMVSRKNRPHSTS